MTNKNVVDALNNNKYLSENVKGDLSIVINRFTESFPDVSLDNLATRLNTLKLNQGSKFLYEEALQYEPVKNTIFVNQEKLKSDNVDAKNALMKTVLSMITAKDNYYGFGGNPSFEALNTGFREIVANNLVGNEGVSDFEDEQILTNAIGEGIGFEVFLKAFFENNANVLATRLFMTTGSDTKVNSLLSKMNNNMYMRRTRGESILFDLQKEVLEYYGTGYSFLMNKLAMESGSKVKYTGYEDLMDYRKQNLETAMKR